MYYIDMSNKKVYECQYDCEAEYVKDDLKMIVMHGCCMEKIQSNVCYHHIHNIGMTIYIVPYVME